jgi:capsular exopolysaccharide synthesis family protein
MQAYGFDESNAGKPTPLPPPDGQAHSPGAEALVPREHSRGHRPKPAAVSAAPNLMGLVNALRRRWALAVTVGLFVGLIVGVLTWFLRPVTHTAQTMLQVNAEQPIILASTHANREDFSSFQRNQIALVKTRSVLNAALRTKTVSSLPLVKEQAEPLEWLEKNILADFPAPLIFRISMRGDDPKQLTPIVEAVRKAYMEEIVFKEKLQEQYRLNKLTELVSQYQETLRTKQGSLKLLQKSVGAATSEVTAKQLEFKQNRIRALEAQLLSRQNMLRDFQMKLLALKAIQDKASDYEVPAETVEAQIAKDKLVEAYKRDISILEGRLNSYKDSFQEPEKNQGYQSTLGRLEGMKKAFAAHVAKLRQDFTKEQQASSREKAAKELKSMEVQVAWLTSMEKQLNADRDKELQSFKSQSDNAVETKWLEKEITEQEGITAKLADRKNTLELEMFAPPRIRELEEGVARPNGTEQGRVGVALMAALVTLIAVIFGIAFLEFKARRVSHIEEVTHGLKINLMGSLPNVPKRALAGSTAPKDMYWQNRLTESVDAIRTTLMNAAKFEGLRVVMVTSAVGGEGKTLLACHLAASLARAGLRTLLIDGDLRRPSVHRLFGLPLPNGLAELLQGDIDADQATHTGLMDGLSVISAGQRDSRAAQALAGQRIREVLDLLRPNYEFIVVDSAPVLPVADSQLIGQHTDGVVFSIMRDVSRLPQVYAAYERLSVLRIRTLGAVVNGISGGSYGAGDYYYIANSSAETASATP